jgi:hypothetical protein
MSVNALSLANGANLLQRFQQANGEPTGGAQNTSDALQTAVQEAKLGEAAVAEDGDPVISGSLLNTCA